MRKPVALICRRVPYYTLTLFWYRHIRFATVPFKPASEENDDDIRVYVYCLSILKKIFFKVICGFMRIAILRCMLLVTEHHGPWVPLVIEHITPWVPLVIEHVTFF